MNRISLIFLFYFLFGGLMIIHSESLITELEALKNIEAWLYQYKKYYNRLPQSMNDLINNYPNNLLFPINNIFELYTEKLGYIINYNTSEGEKYMIARFITKKTRTCRNKLSSPEKS